MRSHTLHALATVFLTAVLSNGCSNDDLIPVLPEGPGPLAVGEISHLGGGLTRSSFEGAWTSPSGRTYAVGPGVAFVHDGSTWTKMTLPERNLGGPIWRPWLLDVWGEEDDDIYAAGRNGTVVHYDGDTWELMDSPTTAHIHGIHGDGTGLVWFAAEDGLWLWHGTGWIEQLAGPIGPCGNPSLRDLRDVWVDETRRVAVGTGGTFVSFLSPGYVCATGVVPGDLLAVNGVAGGAIYAVGTGGAAIVSTDGANWAPITGLDTTVDLYDVGLFRGTAYVVGDGGTVHRLGGLGWSEEASGTSGRLNAIAGGGVDVPIAVGEAGLVAVREANAWAPVYDGGGARIVDVFGFETGEVFAVGTASLGMPVWRFDGAEWTRDAGTAPARGGARAGGARGPAAAPAVLHGIWGSSPTDLFAVGAAGMYHYDGASWTPDPALAGTTLRAVWGYSPGFAVATGDGGRIAHYDGEAWSVLPSPVNTSITDVWGRAPDDVYAVSSTRLLHFDGESWSIDHEGTEFYVAVTGAGEAVYAIGTHVLGGGSFVERRSGGEWTRVATTTEYVGSAWAAAPDRLFLGGDDGRVLLFDGTTLHEVAGDTHPQVLGIWGRSATDVHFVGAPGAFLRYEG